MGRTAYALTALRYCVLGQGWPALLFSLGHSKEEIIRRVLICTAGISSSALARIDSTVLDSPFRPSLNSPALPSVLKAAALLADAPLWIDDSGELSRTELRSKATRWRAEVGGMSAVIVVDHLQFLAGGKAQAALNLRNLRQLAMELSAWIVVTSDLAPAVESRADKHPRISDFQGGLLLPDVADAVLLLYRDVYSRVLYQDRDHPVDRTAEIFIAKTFEPDVPRVLSVRVISEGMGFDELPGLLGTTSAWLA